jgi:hypothetical protein
MPRLIFKCPYLKGGSQNAAHLSNYIRYMATRKGVDKITPGHADWYATKKQKKLVEQLLHDFPMARGMFEYEDYLAAPSRANASEFISRCMEDNLDQVAKRENYVDYIAQRPRVQRLGPHGLFTAGSDFITLSQVADKVAHHSGNVWLPILSLRRENASRLQYDNAERWQRLLCEFAPQMAEAMKIPTEQFRWYAAFHDEGHHPHVHMVVYSADGKSGYLTRKGIAEIKSKLVKEIFAADLTELYQQQTIHRDKLTAQARSSMEQVIREMQAGSIDNTRIEELMVDLSRQLQATKGKKVYGYLKPQLKAVVDEIVDELAKEPRITTAYNLWYQLREDVLYSYKDNLPDRIPLSQQKEFKQIRNMVIQEAMRLGQIEMPDEALPDPPLPGEPEPEVDDGDTPGPRQTVSAVERLIRAARSGRAYAQYRLGRLYQDGDTVDKDILQAVIWFSAAAERGNSYAAYALGKLYLTGENAPKDIKKALRWLQRSADLGNEYAQYRLGVLYLAGEDIPKDVDKAVEYLTASAQQGNQYAQYQLGKLHLLDKEVERDEDTAIRWLSQSAEQGNEYAQWLLDHIEEFRGPSPFQCATRLLHHISQIFQERLPRPPLRVEVDSKLRRRIREKKIAMGHKPDDNEQKL